MVGALVGGLVGSSVVVVAGVGSDDTVGSPVGDSVRTGGGSIGGRVTVGLGDGGATGVGWEGARVIGALVGLNVRGGRVGGKTGGFVGTALGSKGAGVGVGLGVGATKQYFP